MENTPSGFDKQFVDMAQLTAKAFMSDYYYVLITKREEFERLLASATMPTESWVNRLYEMVIAGVLRAIDCCNYGLFRECLDFLCIETPSILSLDTTEEEDCPRVAALLRDYPYLIEIENKYKQLISADKANHLQENLLQIAFGLYDSLNDIEKSFLRLLSLLSERNGPADRIEGGLALGSTGALFGSLPHPPAEPTIGGAIIGCADDRFPLIKSLPDRAILDEAISFRMRWDDFFSNSIMKTGEFYHTLYQAIYEAEFHQNWAFYNDVKNSYPQITDTFYPEYVLSRVEDFYDELDHPLVGQPELTYRTMINSVEDYLRSTRIHPSARSLA